MQWLKLIFALLLGPEGLLDLSLATPGLYILARHIACPANEQARAMLGRWVASQSRHHQRLLRLVDIRLFRRHRYVTHGVLARGAENKSVVCLAFTSTLQLHICTAAALT